MNYVIGTVVCVAGAALIFFLLWRGWRAKVERQSALATPPVPPEHVAAEDISAEFEGMYVSTTPAGERYERIAAHGLGLRTTARLFVARQGVIISRDGAEDLLIPRESLASARAEAGMVGKFVERDGLVVITWDLGGTLVDTGFRTRYAGDRRALLSALENMELAQ